MLAFKIKFFTVSPHWPLSATALECRSSGVSASPVGHLSPPGRGEYIDLRTGHTIYTNLKFKEVSIQRLRRMCLFLRTCLGAQQVFTSAPEVMSSCPGGWNSMSQMSQTFTKMSRGTRRMSGWRARQVPVRARFTFTRRNSDLREWGSFKRYFEETNIIFA